MEECKIGPVLQKIDGIDIWRVNWILHWLECFNGIKSVHDDLNQGTYKPPNKTLLFCTLPSKPTDSTCIL